MNKVAAIVGIGNIGKVFVELLENFYELILIDVFAPYSENYDKINDAELILVTVSTTSDSGYDMTNIVSTLSKIQNDKKIIILSTCPPSFFDTPAAKDKTNLIYSPLFIRQGSIKQDVLNSDFVLAGSRDGNTNLVKKLYENFLPNVEIIQAGLKEIATIKMGINGFLCLKIVYANMIGDYCAANDLDCNLVLESISKFKPVNPYYFKYGFGFGGPCLPIDNTTLSKEINNSFLIRVDEENRKHLDFQVNNFILKNPDKNFEYCFDNVGYKDNVLMFKNSQKLEFLKELFLNGYTIVIKETQSACDVINKIYPNMFLFDVIQE